MKLGKTNYAGDLISPKLSTISGANIGYSDGHVAWKKVSAMRCTDGIKISGGRFLHR